MVEADGRHTTVTVMRVFGYDVQIAGLSPRVATRGAFDTSDLKDPSEWLLRLASAGATSSTGISVTPLRALGVSTYFACVRILSTTLSTLPLEVHQLTAKGRRRALEHPLWSILGRRPNPDMSSVDWRAAVQANLAMVSSGYSEVLRNRAGDAVGVYPIESSRVDLQPQRINGTLTNKLVYRVTDVGLELQPRDVIHLKTNTFNGLIGLNCTQATREVIALALAMQENAAKFFGNGSRPGGVLEHPMSLSKEAQERLTNEFETQTSGANLYRLMVLEEGMKYKGLRSENKDSQFVEARDAQTLEICRIFGVPPHKVGITSGAPKANIEEENLGFVTDVIRPLAVTWEQELDRKLFNENELAAGYCTYFDLDAMLRGNQAARFTAYGTGRQWGILSANDCRAREMLPAIEGGDVYLQPINMIDSKVATKYLLEPPKPAGQDSQKQGGLGGKPDNANKP